MKKTDIISVIVPIYNTEKYLNRCIQSVVNQTYKYLEIILVDDGSPDRCGRICDWWAENDRRIRVIHKKNGGPSDARNVGMDIATGEYVGFVDGDDYIHPEMYQRLYDSIIQCNANIAVCGYYRVDESNGSIISVEKTQEVGVIGKQDALLGLVKSVPLMVMWNKLYTREVVTDLRFPRGKISEDIFILPSIYDRCERVVCISECLYYYAQTPNSITRCERTVKYMDGVEAYYNMLQFCERKGYGELLHTVSAKMLGFYKMVYFQIKKITPHEKTRMREIKKMVRYGYMVYGKSIRRIDILSVELPVVYQALRLIKWRLSPGGILNSKKEDATV